LLRATPFVMVSHAAFPGVTPAVKKKRIPASLFEEMDHRLLRKKMATAALLFRRWKDGGVLAPLDRTGNNRFVGAGGDLGLICHQEDFILRAYEGWSARRARRPIARRVRESAGMCWHQEEGVLRTNHGEAPHSPSTSARVERLARPALEFGEEIRLATFARENARMSMNCAGVMSGTSADESMWHS